MRFQWRSSNNGKIILNQIQPLARKSQSIYFENWKFLKRFQWTSMDIHAKNKIRHFKNRISVEFRWIWCVCTCISNDWYKQTDWENLPLSQLNGNFEFHISTSGSSVNCIISTYNTIYLRIRYGRLCITFQWYEFKWIHNMPYNLRVHFSISKMDSLD